MDHLDKPGTPSSESSGDGVRIVPHESVGLRPALLYKVIALILVVGCVGYLLTLRKTSPDGDGIDATAAEPSEVAPEPRRDMTARPVQSQRYADDDITPFIPPGDPPSMAEVIDRLHKAGIYTGLGAFSPPGTSPPLVGLAVPEDFPLPEGYVRHYQATDDGQRIEPVLMFSPDFQFFDESGQPIKIPDNLVVPPDMAPPGLPIRQIEIPPSPNPKIPSV